MPRRDPIAVRPLPTLAELQTWVAPCDGPRVTVHVPIQRSVPGARQNAVLLEQAAREAEQRLKALGVPEARAAACAAALQRVDLELAHLPNGTRTVAVLLDEHDVRAVALPGETPMGVVVGPHFALRPLLGALHHHPRYRALAISVNRVAHYEGEGERLREVPLAGVPTSLADALGTQLADRESRVLGRTGPYQTHGGVPARDERKTDLVRFHEALARALAPALGDSALPIVLVGTEEHQGGLRAVAKLPALLDEGVVGNFDHATPAELAARCAPVVERWLARRAGDAAALWEQARNRGKGLDLLDDIGAAALASRVARLWVDATRTVPGRVDPQTGQVVAGDGDVLDALCEVVLARGGTVVPVDAAHLPSPTGAAAELR